MVKRTYLTVSIVTNLPMWMNDMTLDETLCLLQLFSDAELLGEWARKPSTIQWACFNHLQYSRVSSWLPWTHHVTASWEPQSKGGRQELKITGLENSPELMNSILVLICIIVLSKLGLRQWHTHLLLSYSQFCEILAGPLLLYCSLNSKLSNTILILCQWSLGVTCWEVFTAGKIPYAGVDPLTLTPLLEDGRRPQIAACSVEMCACSIKLISMQLEIYIRCHHAIEVSDGFLKQAFFSTIWNPAELTQTEASFMSSSQCDMLCSLIWRIKWSVYSCVWSSLCLEIHPSQMCMFSCS